MATALVSTGLTGIVGAPAAVAAPAPDPATFTAGPGLYNGTVPDGACFVDVTVTGGAGGHNMVGGTPATNQPNANGAAAQITARFSVVPEESFSGVVGGGGQQVRTAGANGGGSGGLLTGTNTLHPGAGGGGWTSLQLDGADVVVAGGGGGSGGGHSLTEGGGGDAGLPNAPGVTAGSDGVDGRDDDPTVVVTGGRAGTAAAGVGGTNSADAVRNGTAGSLRTGGDGGPDATPDSGGGGGGGWRGAGGGASTVLNGNGGLSADGVTGAGGGGGSSFVAATSPGASGAAVSGISSVAVGERATAGPGADGEVELDFVPCAYDLAVTKSVDDPAPAPGDTVTWTIVATNNGPDPMTRGDLLTIGDSLPGPGTKTLTSIAVAGGSNNRGLARGSVLCDVAPGNPMPATLTCSRPYESVDFDDSVPGGSRGLDPGESVTITYTQTIPVGTPGATFTNLATVTDRGAPNNNTDDAAITVTPGPPVANDDSASTPFDTPVLLPALADDDASDPGTPLVPSSTVFTSAAATNNGKTLVTPQGTWQVVEAGADIGKVTFTPAPGYTGTTPSVEYEITDTAGGTDRAELVVTVRPGPSAEPDTDTTPQDVTVVLDPAALTNDTPGRAADDTMGTFDASSLVFTPAGTPGGTVTNGGKTLTMPGEGIFTITAGGVVTFDPEPQFTGDTTPAAYTVTDSFGNDTGSTITITVGPIVPVANDDSASTPFNTPVTLPAVADDAAGDPSAPLVPSATVFTSTAATNGGKTLVTPQGTWQVNPNGTVTFTPVAGYSGTTPPVEYRITDDNGTTDTAQLTVTVRPAPTATPDTGTTPQDVTITVPLLPNDTPGPRADGTPGSWDPATVVFTSPNATNGGRTLTVPGQGVYTIDPATGAVTFDPEPGFTGQATPVGYQVRDSNGNTASSTVTITVTPAAPAPAPTPTPDESIDLVLEKRALGGTQVKVGDTVRYRLQVSNNGPGTATAAIRLSDPLPEGLELVSARGKGWTCKTRMASDTVSCVRRQDLGADRKAPPVLVVAKATRSALGRSVNVATVTVAGESARSNNRGQAAVTVVPAQLPATGFRLRARESS